MPAGQDGRRIRIHRHLGQSVENGGSVSSIKRSLDVYMCIWNPPAAFSTMRLTLVGSIVLSQLFQWDP